MAPYPGEALCPLPHEALTEWAGFRDGLAKSICCSSCASALIHPYFLPLVKTGQQAREEEALVCTPCLSPKGPLGQYSFTSLPVTSVTGPPSFPIQSRSTPGTDSAASSPLHLP